jgi:hypothetical protein
VNTLEQTDHQHGHILALLVHASRNDPVDGILPLVPLEVVGVEGKDLFLKEIGED